MSLSAQLSLFCFMTKVAREECSKLRKKRLLVFFNVWIHFPMFFMQVRVSLILQMHEMKRVLHAVACLIVFLLFHDRDWQGVLLKLYEKWSFVSIFCCLVPFPQVFGQVKMWLMLELQKIIRMSHAVSFSIVSPRFYERGW